MHVFFGTSPLGLSGIYYGSNSSLSKSGTSIPGITAFYNIQPDTMDLNTDGFADVVVGTPNGQLFIFYNSNGVIDFNVFTTIISPAGAINFGAYDFIQLDFNDDGFNDLLVGDSPASASGLGVYLFLGSSAGLNTTYSSFFPRAATNHMGLSGSLATADINGDGISDFCGGNRLYNTNEGRVLCWFGESTLSATYPETSADLVFSGLPGDSFGHSVELKDVTNDGQPDLLVGAIQAGLASGLKHGKIHIYRNSNNTFSQTPWFSLIKTSGNTLFGFQTLSFDFNGNGWSEIFITQGGAQNGGTGMGVVNRYELFDTGALTILTTSNTNQSQIQGTASYALHTVTGVEWSTQNSPLANWQPCIADDTLFDEQSEDFTCTISAAPNGKIYVRQFDENFLYTPKSLYASTTYDTAISPPVIQSIGSITPIPNNTSLFYYFTSQTVLLKGTADPSNTIHFSLNSNSYTTVADQNGAFSITLDNLPRSMVTITYYTTDQAGNTTTQKLLTLVIGEENFPPELIPQSTNVPVAESVAVTPATTVTVTPTESYAVIVLDTHNTPLPDTKVRINDIEYTTNSTGQLSIRSELLNNAHIEVFINQQWNNATVIGTNIVVEQQNTQKEKTTTVNSFVVLLLVIVVTSVVVFLTRKKKANQER